MAAVDSRKNLYDVRILMYHEEDGIDVQSKEYENLGPNTGRLRKCVYAECFKRSDENEDGGPPMVKGERQVDQDFVADVSRCVKLLHDVVNMLNGRCNVLNTIKTAKGLTVTALLTNNAKTNASI